MGSISAVLCLLLMLQSAAVPARPTQQGTAELKGRLLDSISGQPVTGVVVRITRTASPPKLPRSTRSDETGSFTFTQLPAGQYTVSVTRDGIITTMFGVAPQRRATATLADGASSDVGALVVPSGVAISGQILDDEARALKGAKVSAWQMRYLSPGERRLEFSGEAISDDAGDYRIAGLRPGRYFVAARASDAIAPTFFPGTATATIAAPVELTANTGATVSIRLLSIPLARVSGTIVNFAGLPSSEFVVILAPLRADGALIGAVTLTSEVDAAGKFAVEKVPPGTYNVEVVSKARIEAIANSGSSVGIKGEGEVGSLRLIVDGADIGDVFIRTAPPAVGSGKVILDGEPISATLAARLTLRTFQNAGPGGMSAVMNASFASPEPTGAFAIPMAPGGRLIRVDGLPAGTMLKRILWRGADVTDEGFDVSTAAINDLVVELTSKPSVVSVRVADDDGVPAGGAGLIVYSEDRRRWQLVQNRVVRSGRTKADGTFSFVGLPAGSYYIATVPSLVDGEWAEPANLERLRATATSFKLVDGETKDLAVTLKKS